MAVSKLDLVRLQTVVCLLILHNEIRRSFKNEEQDAGKVTLRVASMALLRHEPLLE